MILQISFDHTDITKALKIASEVVNLCDIIEVGNPLLYAYGAQVIQEFKKLAPNKPILADTKIVEKGSEIAELLINNGADWITVMGGINNGTIRTVTEKAHDFKRKVMMDVSDIYAPEQSALEAKNLGVNAILFHHNYDEDDPAMFLDKWGIIRGNTDLPIFIEARITPKTSDAILALKPAGIIIGKSIMQSNNPLEMAKYFYELCKK